MTQPDAPTSVYQYFNEAGELLYVGVTARGTARGYEHERTKHWWPLVSSSTVKHYPNRQQALAVESYLIEYWLPPYNIQGRPQGPPRHQRPMATNSFSPEARRAFFGHLSRESTSITPYDIQQLLIKVGVAPTDHLILEFMEMRAERPSEPIAEFRERLKALWKTRST